MPNSTLPPFPSFFKRERPPNLVLTSTSINRSSTSSDSSSENFSPSEPKYLTTPEINAFLRRFSFEEIENLISYGSNTPMKNGQNGVVKEVSLCIKNKTHKLVRKQGGFGVEQENKMTKAIQNAPINPFEFFALPVAQGRDGTTNVLYTSYQEIGDLQAQVDYIQPQYITNPGAVLSYLYQGFSQLLNAIDILNSSEFQDEKGKLHQGIIHNDIKSSNIFLKTNGNFILGDFGCAYFKDEAACQISTFQFSAPELFLNTNFCIEKIDNLNSDLWSLGACLWYLLTNKPISPPLPNEPFSDIGKMLFYKDWAENYPEQWQVLVKNSLNLTGKQSVKELKNTIDSDLNNLQPNNLDNTEQKKEVLKKLALLMLAPALERPSVNELKELMGKFDDYVIYGEPKKFATQLLKCKKAQNPINLDLNNNKFSR